ncbi:hypothetical protein R1sor_015029 [Riccia sorocarpa]|uniref:Late embryogenesis abundant protein LEA-2 subgroup domain-containing protein n=1 Tax=Riccia sorocarpa TaxID=122646 RepID=A0ABD3HEA8_9MARC
MKSSKEGSANYFGYPQYTLIGGSSRSSHSRKDWLSTCSTIRILVAALTVLSVGGIVYLLWPIEPDVNVRHVKLTGIRIDFEEADRKSVLPSIRLDVSLKLDLLITNRNFFGANYDKVFAHIKYRGDELGEMESTGGRVPARSAVTAEAALDLEGKQLYHHVPELLVDVANRELPLEVVAVFFGVVEVLFFNKSEQVTAACNIVIDPKEKLVLSQDCNLL